MKNSFRVTNLIASGRTLLELLNFNGLSETLSICVFLLVEPTSHLIRRGNLLSTRLDHVQSFGTWFCILCIVGNRGRGLAALRLFGDCE